MGLLDWLVARHYQDPVDDNVLGLAENVNDRRGFEPLSHRICVAHGGLPVTSKLHLFPAHEHLGEVERIGEGAAEANEAV